MKKLLTILPLIIILSFMVGCTCNTGCKSLKAQAELEAENFEIVKKYWDAWDNQDIETIKVLFDENTYSFSRTFNNPEPTTYEENIENTLWNFEFFPDAKMEIIDMIADGNKIITMGKWQATYSKDIKELPPAEGQSVESEFFSYIELLNGKIVSEVEIHDFVKFYEQVGMELKPKE